MDKSMRLALISAALLAGVGVFYHFVVFLPGVERDRQAAVERERDDARTKLEREKAESEEKEKSRRVAYEFCNQVASSDYSANWAAACKSVSELRLRQLNDCLNDKAILSNQFMGSSYCQRTYAVSASDAAPECSLPQARGAAINAAWKEARERCATEARLGL